MTQPRHLWSGDWRRESAEAAERLAARRASRAERAPAEPAEAAERPPVEPGPPRVSLLDRLRAALAGVQPAFARIRAALGHVDARRLRRDVLLGIGILLTAAVAYAVVSALRTSDTHPSTPSRSSSVVRSGPAWLGADTTDFPLASGAMVVNVTPSSPADMAGLEPGDVITAINNQPVQSASDLGSALAGLHAGQRVAVTYQQGPSSYTTEVTLQAHPPGP